MSLQVDMEYRANLIAMIVSGVLWALVPVVFFKVLYLHTTQIAGWTWQEMIVLVGTYTFIDAIMMFVMINNMTQLQSDIVSGKLDMVLTRPVDAQFFVSFRSLNYSQVANAIPGVFMIAYGVHGLHHGVTWVRLIGYGVEVLMGMCIYYSVWFIWTISSLWWPSVQQREGMFLSTIVMARYPSDIYSGVARVLFQYVFPVGLIASPAARMLINQTSFTAIVPTIVVGMVFLLVARWVWVRGLRVYASTGS